MGDLVYLDNVIENIKKNTKNDVSVKDIHVNDNEYWSEYILSWRVKK